MRPARWFIPLCPALFLAACHANKPVVSGEGVVLKPRSAGELVQVLNERASGPDSRYYSAKADISFRTPTDNRSFKAHVRMVRDSAAWLSVVPALGIEVARVLLTADSLLLMDKLHDTYWKGDTGDVFRKFGIQANLALLQDALLGKPMGLDLAERYRSDQEDGAYTLTSRERRRFVRAAEDLFPGDTLPNDKDMREKKLERTLRKAERKEAVVYKYWIDPDSLCVQRVQISDLAHDRLADVRYVERANVDGRYLPAVVSLSLSAPGQTASGTLRLDRIQLNGPLNLPFRIPEKFKAME